MIKILIATMATNARLKNKVPFKLPPLMMLLCFSFMFLTPYFFSITYFIMILFKSQELNTKKENFLVFFLDI